MNCEEIKANLPLFSDNILDPAEKSQIESHLPTCPLCRQELDDYRSIRLQLREIETPEIPADLKRSLHAAIPRPRRSREMFEAIGGGSSIGERLGHWLMPFGVGTVGTAILAAFFLSVMFVRPGAGLLPSGESEVASQEDESMLLASETPARRDEYLRIEIPDSSPEVNPASALIALTKSIVRGEMSDEEVVVVADVFGNGIANIAEVVDPPEDAAAMRELRRAFETNPEEAPFLPSRISEDSDAVRVVLKIQRVDVSN